MAETRHGRDGLILKHSGDITQDVFGEESGTCVFQVPPGEWDIMPGVGFQHPLATHMLFERRKVKFSPGFWVVSCDFRGVGDDPAPVYELNYGSGTEPIETHLEFSEKIGGLPSAPKNGAVFYDAQGNVTVDDDIGIFEKFLLKNPDGEDGDDARSFAGMESYLDMNNITWTKTWVTKDLEMLEGGIVQIEKPEGNPPNFKGRDWLHLGMGSTGVRGGSARNRRTWRLSGPDGWISEVYGESDGEVEGL